LERIELEETKEENARMMQGFIEGRRRYYCRSVQLTPVA
jgi:hypothetical protein